MTFLACAWYSEEFNWCYFKKNKQIDKDLHFNDLPNQGDKYEAVTW
jgi:hypothetical protein